MKVVCVNNDAYLNQEMEYLLSVGKVYDVLKIINLTNNIINLTNNSNSFSKGYLINNDKGDKCYYYTDYFITLEEHRENKLDQLGI